MGDNDDKNKWALLIGIDHFPTFNGVLGAKEDQDLIANTLRKSLKGPLEASGFDRLLQDKAMPYFTLICSNVFYEGWCEG